MATYGPPRPILCPYTTCGPVSFGDYLSLIAHLNYAHLGEDLDGRASNCDPVGESRVHPHTSFFFPGGTAPNTFERFHEDPYAKQREHNRYWPFADEAELQLATWLTETLTSAQVTEYLKLDFVRANPPTFTSSHMLRSWIEYLPATPAWKSAPVEIVGYDTIPSNQPVNLIYRDALEVLKYLYGNPLWAQYVATAPEAHYSTSYDRVWSEFNTGCRAWDIQNTMPRGATLVPVHLGSDKITVTNNTGHVEMHPLLMTLACIPSRIRSKLSNHAWVCIAYLPVPTVDILPDFKNVFLNRLAHRAMDTVLKNLKIAARNGVEIADGYGRLRMVYTPVVALSGDMAEHRDMVGVSSSVSTVTEATFEHFGDGVLYPYRAKADILDAIHALACDFDPWKLHDFMRECKKFGLNGVHLPFWRDFLYAEPSLLSVPDILHGVLKFFWDHLLKAALVAVGTEELDARYLALHRHVGYAALRRVSEAKQMTGTMYRHIMRRFVAVLYGAVSPEFLRAMRAIMDFFIDAQSPRHTVFTLARMSRNLQTFHHYKQAIVDAGGRGSLDHWKIPKLEILNTFVPAIISGGALPQYSCDAVERLLRTEAKFPYQCRSNRHRRDYGEQCARYLDRTSRLRDFTTYTLLGKHGVELVPDERDEDDESHNATTGVARAYVQAATGDEAEARRVGGPREMRDLFRTGLLAVGNTIAFGMNRRADHTLALDDAAAMYALPHLRHAIGVYLAQAVGPRDAALLHIDRVSVWSKYHIQYHALKSSELRPQQTMRAQPPSPEYPLGLCDAVLVDSVDATGESRPQGALVVQVRMVFKLNLPSVENVPQALALPLVYAQDFQFADIDVNGRPARVRDILMYRLQRRLWVDRWNTVHRAGIVFPLTNVRRMVDLVPVHGAEMDTRLSEATAMEVPTHFFLNDHFDLDDLDALAM